MIYNNKMKNKINKISKYKINCKLQYKIYIKKYKINRIKTNKMKNTFKIN